jgi:hypothetical protein
MADEWPQAGFAGGGAEPFDRLFGKRRESPLRWGFKKQLQTIGPKVAGAIDGLVDAAGHRKMGAESGHGTA